MDFQPHTTRFMNSLPFDDKMDLLNMDPVGRMGSISYLSNGGLYIHVPFCHRKCLYCDFYSIGDRNADWHGFTDALIAELNGRTGEIPRALRTVYIGGGTPSLMPSEEFSRLCDAVMKHKSSSDFAEFTIEVNPDDVSPEKVDVWKRGGVTRLSMGIQSFDNRILNRIRRRHSAETAVNAYNTIRPVFDNVSIDLIYGIPGQTPEMWRNDVEKAISLRPEHISSYSLMYEPGTALTLLRDRGDIRETDDDTSEKMYGMLIRLLREAGYEHYEISNFALPGFRSIHNSSYWRQTPYLGIGPSAHSYDGNRCRSFNPANVAEYIAYWKGERSIGEKQNEFITREYLTDKELMEEFIMTGLRTRDGINLKQFKTIFGDNQYDILMHKSARWLENNALKLKDNHLALAEESIMISDAIIVDLI